MHILSTMHGALYVWAAPAKRADYRCAAGRHGKVEHLIRGATVAVLLVIHVKYDQKAESAAAVPNDHDDDCMACQSSMHMRFELQWLQARRLCS